MLANSLTKASDTQQIDLYFSQGCRYRLTYDPNFMSARKRRAKGLQVLGDELGEDDEMNSKFHLLFDDIEIDKES